MVDTLCVHGFNSADQLEHEVADMFSLQGSLAHANSFIQVAVRTELKDKVDVVRGLERLKEVDNVGVRAKAKVDA